MEEMVFSINLSSSLFHVYFVVAFERFVLGGSIDVGPDSHGLDVGSFNLWACAC